MGCCVSKNNHKSKNTNFKLSNDLTLHEKRSLFDYKFSPKEDNIYTFLSYFPDLPLVNIKLENVEQDKEKDYLGDNPDCEYIALFFINTSGTDFSGGHLIFPGIKKEFRVVPERKTGVIFNSKDQYKMSPIKKGILQYMKVEIFKN